MALRERYRAWRAKINAQLVKRSIVKMVTFKSVEFVGTTVFAYWVLSQVGDGGDGGILAALLISFVTDFVIPGAWYVLHEFLWEASDREKLAELAGDPGTKFLE